MSKLNLKSAGFLTLALFCSHSWAQTPWEADSQSETVSTTPDVEVTSPAMTDTQKYTPPAREPIAGSPLMNEESNTAASVETTTQGDVLSMPSQQPTAQASAVRLLDFPRRGMSQDKVQNEMGRPGEIIPAIGQPPITRWVYDDRIVYFEYASVIHVVAK